MKNINLSDVTNNAGFPVTKTTWDHLQDAYKEGFEAMARAAVGPAIASNTGYVLFGCEKTVTGNDVAISAGAILWQQEDINAIKYQPEIFFCDAQTLVGAASSNIYGKMKVTYHADDPVTFTDFTNNHNVHEIRKIEWGTSQTIPGIPFGNLQRAKPSFVKFGNTSWTNPVFTFKQNQNYIYTGTVSNTPTFSMNFTSAVPGVEVNFTVTSPNMPAYTAPSSTNVTLITQNTPPNPGYPYTHIVSLRYMGEKDGTHFIIIRYYY